MVWARRTGWVSGLWSARGRLPWLANTPSSTPCLARALCGNRESSRRPDTHPIHRSSNVGTPGVARRYCPLVPVAVCAGAGPICGCHRRRTPTTALTRECLHARADTREWAGERACRHRHSGRSVTETDERKISPPPGHPPHPPKQHRWHATVCAPTLNSRVCGGVRGRRPYLRLPQRARATHGVDGGLLINPGRRPRVGRRTRMPPQAQWAVCD
jgi:hypothetical protein